MTNPDDPAKSNAMPRAGRAFLRQLIVSMLVTKAGLLYFGAYYSSFPGRGYGWGLAGTCVFAVISLFSLAWRYRNADL